MDPAVQRAHLDADATLSLAAGRVYLAGLIPLLIGVALLVYVYTMAPKVVSAIQ
jgi:hypothetical protein